MTVQFVTCPDCRCLVSDTLEERRLHRAADKQIATVLEAIRRTAKRAEEAAAAAHQLARGTHADLDRIERQLRDASEAPQPPAAIVNGWPDDELDDDDPTPTAAEEAGTWGDDDDEDPLTDPDDADDEDGPVSPVAPAYTYPGQGLYTPNTTLDPT